ncbi:DUF1674-domain-containing protein [Melanomma pulvis-pyrius CBS 109.77]|uniref:Succinate dehydrogenase assembly factor 4, mitochondrial n=1 Tax=Melanomma pulvis-pyrius CBS 109.77 TaxID=1314802 RepID=A0A6A6WTS1_9PLEO|nr:DUF1674-domain-containing protein [Melanomma pulvis-pyrius CBS 109.77]
MRSLQTARRHLSPRILASRPFSTTPRPSTSVFDRGPAPPRLPKDEQEVFERLQRQSTGAFSTPREDSSISTSPASTTSTTSTSQPSFSPSDIRARINQSPASSQTTSQPETTEEGGVHPHLRRGAPPEFEGDVNPKTGEVGGPKNEPLRWGGEGDWSFNGRVSDF